MSRITLQNLGSIVRERRGDKGLREVAREIGTSPATLSRVESGKLPEVTTFGKICKWLRIDPATFLGISDTGYDDASTGTAVAHLKAKKEIHPNTAKALANVIIRAQQMLADLPEGDDGTRI